MNTAMELEDLENIKNDFLPLLPLIKQELLDNNETTPNPCDSVEKQVDETTAPGEPISTKCVWCSQVLSSNDRPKLLECLHIACASCVTTKFSELDRTMPPLIHCPVCNMASQNEFIIDNQFLIEQSNVTEDGQSSNELENKVQLKCSSCSDDANATSWCVDCSEYICDNCVQAHQRLKITKDHTIKPKENGKESTSKSLMCSTHPQEKLSLFCETCDRLTCRDCQLVDHRDHKYKFAHEIATETRSSLSSLLSEINYKRFLLTSAHKVINDRQNSIAEKKKELIKDITTMVVKITNTVNSRGKQLALRLNEVCDSKLKVLNEKKEALQLLSDNTDHCIEFVQSALDKGSDCAILYSKKSLARHLQKLKCQRADIPNPEIPVRIQIQLNQVPELQKVISQMGTIIVDGKPYPPPPSSNAPPRQQPSPNMAPPLRPGLPPPGMSQISPGGPGGFQTTPPMYNSSAQQQQQQQQQQFNNLQMTRPFGPDGTPVRFTNMGPHGMQRQGQPHVSSSTHPQNMDISLRGLLNNQGGQPQGPSPHMGYSGPPSYPASPNQNPSQHQNIPPQMRPHFMGGPPSQQHQNFSQGQPPNGPSFMNNAPRFQNFQRLSSHASQNIPTQQPNPMRPMMQNSMSFPGPQQVFNQNPPQTSQQMSINLHSVAKWHIPQSAQQSNGSAGQTQGPLMQFPNGRPGENFKISLKSPNTLKGNANGQNNGSNTVLPNVTSTNPKTPSPSTNDVSKDFTEPIDKVRDDSINDLMATIAKLDSNGVQVLPEGRNKTTSPQVHSSTDLPAASEDKNDQKDDPNEDWCAVCLDGGELMCCDKCPKVFHQNCHIPAISSLPDESETWQCLLCVNLADLAAAVANTKPTGVLTESELKIVQRICLELYCQYEQSLPLREPEPSTNTAYYEIICTPMSLDVIRTRLDPSSPNHYKDVATFVADVRLLFKNVYLFYQEDSKTYTHARCLENFFEEQLIKWLPKYAAANSNHKDDECNPPKRSRKYSD